MNYFYAAGTVTPLIDAGIVPEQPVEEFVFSHWEWLYASTEEIEALTNVELYSNQTYIRMTNPARDEVKVRIEYDTPCITSLREVGT